MRGVLRNGNGESYWQLFLRTDTVPHPLAIKLHRVITKNAYYIFEELSFYINFFLG